MDLWHLLDELHRERKRLDRMIQNLEALRRGERIQPLPPSRRGRRNMPPAERKAVSERMKAWWRQRRQNGADALG
jgi:hypothetical protein